MKCMGMKGRGEENKRQPAQRPPVPAGEGKDAPVSDVGAERGTRPPGGTESGDRGRLYFLR